MQLVTLRDGPTVPVDVIALAVSLEMAGYRLIAEGEHLRLSQAGSRDPLPEATKDLIRHWKTHLLTLIRYDAVSI